MTLFSARRALAVDPDLSNLWGWRLPRNGRGVPGRQAHVGLIVFSPSPCVSAATLGSPAGSSARRWTGDWDEEEYMPVDKRRHWITGRAVTISGCAALLGGIALAGSASPGLAATKAPAAHPVSQVMATNACHLGNSVKHVIQITFDNVHFFRDNPNVPSDLEMMPNLLHFFENNGTFLSNNHTPLIAHTAVDILSTYTGLYGDRDGVPISNSYRTYNADGPGGSFNATDPATAFTYWTAPIFDTASKPNPAHDTNPNMVYSPVPPATAATLVTPNTVTPAPWAPYTRAGCDWGAVATANVELENTGVDMPTVFGPNSPEVAQLAADPDSH